MNKRQIFAIQTGLTVLLLMIFVLLVVNVFHPLILPNVIVPLISLTVGGFFYGYFVKSEQRRYLFLGIVLLFAGSFQLLNQILG